jgi:hypothetical protein
MANRHERRKARKTSGRIRLDRINSTCDIQVDGKVEQYVMISANGDGRKIVEDQWPDVQWTTDEKFASCHSPEWLFTHIRVTKLPTHLAESVPLEFASPDALAFAVATALQRHAPAQRVIFYTGYGADITINRIDGAQASNSPLYAEYVPAGTPIGAPSTMQ